MKKTFLKRLAFGLLVALTLVSCSISINLPDLSSIPQNVATAFAQVTLSVTQEPPGSTPTGAAAPAGATATPYQPAAPTSPAKATVTRTPKPEEPLIQVFFTSMDGERDEDGKLEQAILADLASAKKSIDVAMYNFSLKRAEEALIAAQKRGVVVRFVTDSDDVQDEPIKRLKKAGIKVVGDRREPIMHNKFVVIDGKIVWMGSLNLTGSGTYKDNNNMVRFISDELASNYTVEFEEMFLRDKFGPDSPANTPFQSLKVGRVQVENYFSPEDKIAPRLVRLVASAKTSVDFLAYSFTLDSLADAMLNGASVGVQVRGVFESDQVESNTGTEYPRLKKAKLDVRRDNNSGLMHHKVIIIDRKIVIFGSYNFSSNADRQNDENLVIIYDANVARQFQAEFDRVFNQSPR